MIKVQFIKVVNQNVYNHFQTQDWNVILQWKFVFSLTDTWTKKIKHGPLESSMLYAVLPKLFPIRTCDCCVPSFSKAVRLLCTTQQTTPAEPRCSSSANCHQSARLAAALRECSQGQVLCVSEPDTATQTKEGVKGTLYELCGILRRSLTCMIL